MARRSHRKARRSSRRPSVRVLLRNPANKQMLVVGGGLLAAAAAWYFLRGASAAGGKIDPRKLPQPPGCNGNTTVSAINRAGDSVYNVAYADGRIGTLFKTGVVHVGCKDGSVWELAPGQNWFQLIDASGKMFTTPYNAPLAFY